jgi:hypothetical protein
MISTVMAIVEHSYYATYKAGEQQEYEIECSDGGNLKSGPYFFLVCYTV